MKIQKEHMAIMPTWGEYGRSRVSGHLYDGSGDGERFLDVLGEIG